MQHASKLAKTMVKWLNLRMSSCKWADLPAMLWTDCISLLWPIHYHCHIFKIPFIRQNFLNLVAWRAHCWYCDDLTVTRWLCDKLTVTNRPFAELTLWRELVMWRVDWQPHGVTRIRRIGDIHWSCLNQDAERQLDKTSSVYASWMSGTNGAIGHWSDIGQRFQELTGSTLDRYGRLQLTRYTVHQQVTSNKNRPITGLYSFNYLTIY